MATQTKSKDSNGGASCEMNTGLHLTVAGGLHLRIAYKTLIQCHLGYKHQIQKGYRAGGGDDDRLAVKTKYFKLLLASTTSI